MEGSTRRDPWLGKILGKLSLRSAAHPVATIIVIVLLTGIAGAGMAKLETSSDMLKILPKDDPTTLAAQNASKEYRGFYDFVTIFYEIDEGKCGSLSDDKLPYRLSEPACGNITDQVYVRAMDEIWSLAQQEIPSAIHAIDLAAIVKVVNYTNSGIAVSDANLQDLLAGNPTAAVGAQDEAFSMPGTDPVGSAQYEAAWQGALYGDESVKDAVAPTFRAGRTLVFFEPGTADENRIALGNAIYDFVDHYQEMVEACDGAGPCNLKWNAFNSEGLAVRGVSSNDAHASAVTQRDIAKLAPIVIWAILMVMYLAFRDVRVILVSVTNLAVAFIWTAGLMGWLEIPFSALNMTVVPLILGVGIDYGIHMISEFLEHKSDGLTNHESFQEAGNRAGIAMALATITTVSGLLLMALSPSVLMAQLGIVSSIALIATFIISLTLIPALLSLTRKEARRRKQVGSKAILGFSRVVSKYRPVTIVLLLLVTGAAGYSLQSLEPEGFGNPELNYPEGDRLRDDAQFIADVFYGGQTDAQANFLILEGDMTRPEVHLLIDALMTGLLEDPELQAFNVASPTRIVRAWKAIERGTPDAVVDKFILGQVPDSRVQDYEYPATQEEIKATFDTIYASPFSNFMTVLLQEDGYMMATVSYDTTQSMEFDEVVRIWDATQRVIANARLETGVYDVHVEPFGNNAFSYLFITKEQPWVNAVGFMGFGLVVLLIALLTRSVKATLCTACAMGVTSIWWLGVLPLMGVGLSVGLMLPMVFIMAIGTDDAVHLIWNMQRTDDREKVYRFVGKAVMLTSITTFLAFAIFSRQTERLVEQTLLATSVAIAIMWFATMLLVPLFYPPPRKAKQPIVKAIRSKKVVTDIQVKA